jgi:hypothetical protein
MARPAAILFAREGAKVLCVDAEVGRAEETVKMISDEGNAAVAVRRRRHARRGLQGDGRARRQPLGRARHPAQQRRASNRAST